MDRLKWLDIPPVWLVALLVLASQVGKAVPVALPLGGLGAVLIGAGLVLMGLAVIEMRRSRTTVLPHQEASHLVTTGIFRWTRNPIYLGDALVLTGFALRWDALLALPLVAVFVWVIRRRFIDPEEARLARRFGPAFDAYTRATRRWI